MDETWMPWESHRCSKRCANPMGSTESLFWKRGTATWKQKASALPATKEVAACVGGSPVLVGVAMAEPPQATDQT